MPSIFHLAVAAAFLPLSIASPHPRSPSSFTVKQSANPNHVKNGRKDYIKALAKYGSGQSKLGVNVLSSIRNSTGTVSATPEQFDSEYLSPVTISGQTFNLDFDTGSSDLWVFGADLKAKSQNAKHTFYQPQASAKQINGATWKIAYGDQSSASGVVFTDTVDIGGIKVTGQAVEVATVASTEFLTGAPDGLVGLAFDTINTVKPKQQKTWFTNAVSQGIKAVFTADLYPGKAGTYIFGAIDNKLHDGEIVYTDIDSSEGFWTFTPDSVTVGNGQAMKAKAGIADTGTTLMLLEDTVTTAYYKQVKGAKIDARQGGYVFDCNAKLPDFTVKINGFNSVVPGKFINFAPTDDGTNNCYGGIQSSAGIGIQIYGDVWLKSAFVVFDATSGTPKMGVANKAGAGAGSNSGSGSGSGTDSGSGTGTGEGEGTGTGTGEGEGTGTGTGTGEGEGTGTGTGEGEGTGTGTGSDGSDGSDSDGSEGTDGTQIPDEGLLPETSETGTGNTSGSTTTTGTGATFLEGFPQSVQDWITEITSHLSGSHSH